MEDEVAEAEGYAKEAGSIAHILIETQRSEDGVRSNLFLARAAQSLNSCALLCCKGFMADAMSCARTIVELDIEYAYIMQDVSDRWERYCMFEDVATNRMMIAMAALLERRGRPVDRSILERWQERSRAAVARVGTDRSWAGLNPRGGPISLRQRAVAVGKELEYDLAYSDMCWASHAGFATLRYVLPKGMEAPLKILAGPDDPKPRPIMIALPSMIGLIKNAPDADSVRERGDNLEVKIRGSVAGAE